MFVVVVFEVVVVVADEVVEMDDIVLEMWVRVLLLVGDVLSVVLF